MASPIAHPIQLSKENAPGMERQRSTSLYNQIIAASILGDVVAVILGLFAGHWLRFESGLITFGVQLTTSPQLYDYFGLIMVGTISLLSVFGYFELYDRHVLLRFRRTALIVFKSIFLWFMIYLGVSLALKFDPPISRIYAAGSAVTCFLTTTIWRYLLWTFTSTESVAKAIRQKVIFIGWNTETDNLYSEVLADRNHPYEVQGCFSSLSGNSNLKPSPELIILGEYSQLPGFLQTHKIDMVVLADLDIPTSNIIELANLCEKHFVHFKIIPSYFQILLSGLQLESISGVPVLGVSQLPLERLINRFFKRLLDIVGSLIGLMISLPFLLIFGLLIYIESPGSIFFKQERIGKNGRKFHMLKLRSMQLQADQLDHKNQSTLRDDPRLLKVGKFIRSWNIDELPQFWNALIGDMSLVGPRPERTYHSEKLSSEIPHYNARYTSKPGITGWAQINGFRGDTSLEERIRYDLYYLENWTLLMDFQILFMTFFSRKNAY